MGFECVNKNLRTLDKWQELADELITMEKEEGNLFVVTDNNKKLNCYNCGKKGHMAKDCYSKARGSTEMEEKKESSNKKESKSSEKKEKKCFECGSVRHMRKDCPKLKVHVVQGDQGNNFEIQATLVYADKNLSQYTDLLDTGAGVCVVHSHLIPVDVPFESYIFW
jgi:hypothetical protein